MEPSQVPEVIASFAPPIPEGVHDIAEHFRSKYPEIDYQGRRVFLFTNERDFGNNRHAVSVHGPGAWEIPQHIYSYPLITYCYAGRFPLMVGDEFVKLEVGQCFVSDRHVPHGVLPTDAETCAVNIVLADAFLGSRFAELASLVPSPFVSNLSFFGAPHDQWRIYDTSNDTFVREIIDRILCESFDAGACSGYICDALIYSLLAHIFRTHESYNAPSETSLKQQALVGEIRAYISEHYREGSLAKMAADLGYDRSYLSTFVRKNCGLTFKQLVNIERMRHAGLLLRGTPMPIYEVAESVGIVNLTAFYKRFKEHAGCTPQEYRQRASEANQLRPSVNGVSNV